MGFESILIERCIKMTARLDEADGSTTDRQSKVLEAAVIGCNALRDLSAEKMSNDFKRAVNILYDARRENRAEFRAITTRLDHFSAFLNTELKVLVSGGFPEYLANQLIGWCFESYEEVRRGETDPATLFQRIQLFADHACQLSDELISQSEEEQQDQNAKRQLLVILKVMAGAGLIGLNAGAALLVGTANAALTAAGAAVSGAVGSAIISSAKWPAKVKVAGSPS